MKQLLFTISLCLAMFGTQAQDSLVTQQQLRTFATSVNSRMDSLSQTLQQNGNAARTQDTTKPADYVDESKIEALKKDASELYIKPACKKWVYQWGGWLLFVVVLLAGIYLFATTDLCRDESFDDAGNLRPVKQRPYSYSRVQMFWWTMIILCCYVAFFALYGNLIPLNMTTVILLGLGSVVYGLGKVLDERQKMQNPLGDRHQDDNASKDHFFTDILSDDAGISIHRFQTLIFNVAFGIGFISYFVASLCLSRYPFIELNEWQFALLGISSATYLGLKASENNPATPPPPPANSPNPAPPVQPNPPANP